MIDVQMILMGNEDPSWLALCEAGLVSPVVNVHKGQGIVGNLNAARIAVWDTCGGDILSCVDPDDIPDASAWQKIQDVFDKNPNLLAVNTLEKQINVKGLPIALQTDTTGKDPLASPTTAHHIFAFRRELYDAVRPYIQLYPYGGEWFLTIAAFHLNSLVCIPEILYQWRRHPSSMTTKYRFDRNMGTNFITWLRGQDYYKHLVSEHGLK